MRKKKRSASVSIGNWDNSKRAKSIRMQNPFGDFDKDRVININDCQPFNPYEHGWLGDTWSSITQRVTTAVTPTYKRVTSYVKPYIAPITTVIPKVTQVVKKYTYDLPETSYEVAAARRKERREAIRKVVETKDFPKIIPTPIAPKDMRPDIFKRQIPPSIFGTPERAVAAVRGIQPIIQRGAGVIVSKAKEIIGYHPEKERALNRNVSQYESTSLSLANQLNITSGVSGKKAIVVNGTRYVQGDKGFDEALSKSIDNKLASTPLSVQPTTELQTHINEGERLYKIAKNAGWVGADDIIRYPDTKVGNEWAKKYNTWIIKNKTYIGKVSRGEDYYVSALQKQKIPADDVTFGQFYDSKHYVYTPKSKGISDNVSELNKLSTNINKQVEAAEVRHRASFFGAMGKYEDVEAKVSPYVSKVIPPVRAYGEVQTADDYIKALESTRKWSGLPPLTTTEKKKALEGWKVSQEVYGDYRKIFGLKPEPYKFEKTGAELIAGIKVGAVEELRAKPAKTALTAAAFMALPVVTKGVGYVWGVRAGKVGVGAAKVLPKVTKYAPKAIGYGLLSVYAGSVSHEITGIKYDKGLKFDFLTPEKGGEVLGRTGVELAAMGFGYGIGKKAIPDVVEFPGMKGYTWGKKKITYDIEIETPTGEVIGKPIRGKISELQYPTVGIYKFTGKPSQLRWGMSQFKISKLVPDVPKQVFKGKPYTTTLKGKILEGTPKSKSIVSGKKAALEFHHIIKSGPKEAGVLMTYNEHKAITIAMGELGKPVGRGTKFYDLFRERKTITSKEVADMSKYSKSGQFKRDVDYILKNYKELMIPGMYEPKTPTESLMSLVSLEATGGRAAKIVYPEIISGRLKTVEVKPTDFRPVIIETLAQHKIPNVEKVTDAIIKLMIKRKVTLFGSAGIRAAEAQLGRVSLARVPRDFDFHLKSGKEVAQFKPEVVAVVNKAAGKEILVLTKGKVLVKNTEAKFADIKSDAPPPTEYGVGFGEEYLRWGIKTEKPVRTKEGFLTPTYSEQMYRKFSAMLISGKPREMTGTLFKEGKQITIKGRLMPEHKGRLKDIGDYYTGEMARAYKLYEMGHHIEAKTIVKFLNARVAAFGKPANIELKRGYNALLKAEIAAKKVGKKGPLTKIFEGLDKPEIIFSGEACSYSSRAASKIAGISKYSDLGYIGASKLLYSYDIPSKVRPYKYSVVSPKISELASMLGIPSKVPPSKVPPSKVPPSKGPSTVSISEVPSKTPPSKPPPSKIPPYYPPSKTPPSKVPPYYPPLLFIPGFPPYPPPPKKKKVKKKKIPIKRIQIGAYKYGEITPVAMPKQALGLLGVETNSNHKVIIGLIGEKKTGKKSKKKKQEKVVLM